MPKQEVVELAEGDDDGGEDLGGYAEGDDGGELEPG